MDRNGLTRAKDRRLEMSGTIAIDLVMAPNSFRNKLIKEPSSVLDKYELPNETKQLILEAVRGNYY